ncbi:MAG: hypothetical protein L6V81_11655 [Clostridium sp.]|nr:MAG: hypothetical protein L6V81_11655 [Clostridium sp.]
MSRSNIFKKTYFINCSSNSINNTSDLSLPVRLELLSTREAIPSIVLLPSLL